MEIALAVVGACALAFWPLVFCAAVLLRLTAGLRRLRGGRDKPRALYAVSPVDVSTTSGTHVSAVYFSSPGEPGSASAGVAIRPTPPRPSSGTALGFSGTSLTVTDGLSIGDHGLRLRLADSEVA